MKDSAYHSLLRVAVVVVALMLVFDSGVLVKQTSVLSEETKRHVASVVGVVAVVAPNELNVLTARITELERDLEAKERVIAVAVDRGVGESAPLNTSTLILSLILFILLALIVLNYYLDYRRGQFSPLLGTGNLNQV